MRTVTVLVSLVVAAAAGFAANTFLQRPIAQLTAATPARAAEASETGEMLTLISAEQLSKVITELGGTEVEIHDQSGEKIITFKDGDTPFNFALTLCNVRPGGCLGVVMLVGFDPGDTRYPVELFNTFNLQNPFVSTFIVEGNKFAVARMLLLEGGIGRKNLDANIANFAAAPGELTKYLNSQLVAGYQAGGSFQHASYGTGGFARPVRLDPRQVVDIVRRQTQLPGRQSLRR